MKARPMRAGDLDAVLDIERRSFPLPWSRESFLRELREVENARLLVAVDEGGPPAAPELPRAGVLGYACWWEVPEECHITNFAVAPGRRRRGVGALLLERALADAKDRGLLRATLEVRAGNAAAIALYEKHGFTAAAMRPRYYPDNREDALVMWKERT